MYKLGIVGRGDACRRYERVSSVRGGQWQECRSIRLQVASGVITSKGMWGKSGPDLCTETVTGNLLSLTGGGI